MSLPLIQVSNLSFAYPNGPTVLNQLSFTIQSGDRVGLAGLNGAGKSTLLLCLAGVMPIRPGCIAIDGFDPATAAERRQLPARLGLLFQNPDDQLIHATVADDVAFGPLNLGVPKNEIPQRIAVALKQVGLSGQGDRVPNRMSGGEKRRAALAGILAMQPKIILLDEPTSDLDARGKQELARLLQQLSTTLVIATHDLELIRRVCSRTIIMESGQAVADGPTTNLLNDANLLAKHGLAAS